MSSNTDDIEMDAVAVGSTSEREMTRDAVILQGDGNDVVRMLLASPVILAGEKCAVLTRETGPDFFQCSYPVCHVK